MKYVTVYPKRTATISPSPYTLAAIVRVNSGNVVEETLISRLKSILKIRHSSMLESAIAQMSSLRVARKKALLQSPQKLELTAVSSTLDAKLVVTDVDYRNKEKRVLKELTEEEFTDYWNNLLQLALEKKLRSKFHDHPLEDYTSKLGNVRYTQNLLGFRSFALRPDKGFKARAKKDVFAVSNAIICLYKPVTIMNKLILYNIGKHDDVYNTEITDYAIDINCLKD